MSGKTASEVAAAAVMPPHAPVTGRLRRLLGPFHYTGIFWYRFPVWGVKVLPNWAVGIFVNLFTVIFFLALGGVRRAVASNLDVLLGPCRGWRRWRRAYRTFLNFAWCLTERYERLATTRNVELEVEGQEHWDRLAAEERGFVLVTAHVGHWEVGALTPGSKRKRRVHVAREEELDPTAQRFLQGLLAAKGDEGVVFHFAGEDPRFGIKLFQYLREGDVVALQADRPRAHSQAVMAHLFGRPFPLPPGPISMSRAAGVPILPFFAFRKGRLATRLVFRPPIEVPSGSSREQGMHETVERIVAELEWALSQDPNQWFCFREVWPKGAAEP